MIVAAYVAMHSGLFNCGFVVTSDAAYVTMFFYVVTGEFPTQIASNADNNSIGWNCCSNAGPWPFVEGIRRWPLKHQISYFYSYDSDTVPKILHISGFNTSWLESIMEYPCMKYVSTHPHWNIRQLTSSDNVSLVACPPGARPLYNPMLAHW